MHLPGGLTAKIPTITLKPGETYRQALPLNAVLSNPNPQPGFAYGPGKYHVTLLTSLQVLVGEPNGAWADFGAIRVPVSNTAEVRKQ